MILSFASLHPDPEEKTGAIEVATKKAEKMLKDSVLRLEHMTQKTKPGACREILRAATVAEVEEIASFYLHATDSVEP